MGYTRYWDRTKEPITQEFIDEVKKIFNECKAKGITICNWDGRGEPTLTLEEIAFNGLAPYLDHESFVIRSEPDVVWDFCKTAGKPYDYAVKEVLKVAKKMGIVSGVSSDGDIPECNDKEYLNEWRY